VTLEQLNKLIRHVAHRVGESMLAPLLERIAKMSEQLDKLTAATDRVAKSVGGVIERANAKIAAQEATIADLKAQLATATPDLTGEVTQLGSIADTADAAFQAPPPVAVPAPAAETPPAP